MRATDPTRRAAVRIAIIGGGFSGTMTAVNLLLLKPETSFSLSLIERKENIGEGIAYGTKIPSHLLNVIAERMSAFEEEPDNFLEFAKAWDPRIDRLSFVSRKLYGSYLKELLRRALAEKAPQNEYQSIMGQAVGLDVDKHRSVRISLQDGQEIVADRVVLACGNLTPPDPYVANREFYLSKFYVGDPWGRPLELDKPYHDVLLIGSGLTAVDKVLELLETDHQGRIHMVSRHGLLPQVHAGIGVAAPFHVPDLPLSARGFVHNFNQIVKASEDWRPYVTALCSLTQDWWAKLPIDEQRRFLRHFQSYWDVHRHRMAPQIATKIQHLITTGRLIVHRGTIVEYKEGGNYVEAMVRNRLGQAVDVITVSKVVNCCGYATNPLKSKDPLICDLLSKKLAVPNTLGLGLKAAADGALINARGIKTGLFFALGSLLRGQMFENGAVPVLRIQAKEMALTIASSIVDTNQ